MASTIKVDNVQNQPGTNVVNKCGTTVNIGAASDNIRSAGNNLQASDGGNLISQSGTTITLGASGDTITLASGASQTGFGREGSVDWQTGSIKTGTFTAATGEGYFVNTSGGTATVNLPAGVAGSIVAIADYTRTFSSNNCTIAANGSEKLGGVAQDALLQVDGQSATFVYVDATEGWINVQETESSVTGLTPFINATGGTITTSGDYKIHKFTGPGTFCVSSLSPGPSGNPNIADYLVVAGGGGGGTSCAGGGGGAGGYRESHCATTSGPYTASPIAAPNSPSSASLPISVQAYTITVGAGGAGVCSPPSVATGGDGNNSTFSSITSTAGGGGGGSLNTGRDGGSGGGGGHGGAGGSGNTPPVSPAQGTDGSASAPGAGPAPGDAGGAGGGATVAGTAGPSGHQGGAGTTTEITASPVAYAGGGGGSNRCGGTAPDVAGGTGGGGPGGFGSRPGPLPNSTGCSGTANTGGGGGAGKSAVSGPPNQYGGSGNGGSGIVVIRYKYQ